MKIELVGIRKTSSCCQRRIPIEKDNLTMAKPIFQYFKTLKAKLMSAPASKTDMDLLVSLCREAGPGHSCTSVVLGELHRPQQQQAIARAGMEHICEMEVTRSSLFARINICQRWQFILLYNQSWERETYSQLNCESLGFTFKSQEVQNFC